MLAQRLAQVAHRIQQAFELANQLYQVDLSNTLVRFDLRGRVAGYATCYELSNNEYNTELRFNVDMIANGSFDMMLNDTVPHEVAHLVCMLRPELGTDHNIGWQAVCRALGGAGTRTHDRPVVYARGRTYQYRTTTGATVHISEQRHRRIQAGKTYTVQGRGLINRHCYHNVYSPA